MKSTKIFINEELEFAIEFSWENKEGEYPTFIKYRVVKVVSQEINGKDVF